jgi:uncharacterized protein (DUF1330 family)
MSAYFVIDLDIHDTARFQEYRRQVDRMIAKYEGRYLVAGRDGRSLGGPLAAEAAHRHRVPEQSARSGVLPFDGVS